MILKQNFNITKLILKKLTHNILAVLSFAALLTYQNFTKICTSFNSPFSFSLNFYQM